MPQILHRMPSDLCMQKPAHPWHSFLYFFFLPWEARSHHPHSSGFAHLRLQLSFFFFTKHTFPQLGKQVMSEGTCPLHMFAFLTLNSSESAHTVKPFQELLEKPSSSLNMSPLGKGSRPRDGTQAGGTG